MNYDVLIMKPVVITTTYEPMFLADRVTWSVKWGVGNFQEGVIEIDKYMEVTMLVEDWKATKKISHLYEMHMTNAQLSLKEAILGELGEDTFKEVRKVPYDEHTRIRC